jgi:hypothetical protein
MNNKESLNKQQAAAKGTARLNNTQPKEQQGESKLNSEEKQPKEHGRNSQMNSK